MKRIFLVFFSTLALLSVNVATVSAQFTLLPSAGSCTEGEKQEDCDKRINAACEKTLNEYELSREIKTEKQINAETKAADAKENLNTYLGDLEPLGGEFGLCVKNDEFASDKCKELHKASDDAAKESETAAQENTLGYEELLGCGIKTGRVSLQMIPFFISFFANFLIGMSGLISVLFIVIGGFMYIYGGLTDQKERGKKYIGNALMGMVLALMAWTIVSVIIFALTS